MGKPHIIGQAGEGKQMFAVAVDTREEFVIFASDEAEAHELAAQHESVQGRRIVSVIARNESVMAPLAREACASSDDDK